MYYPYFIAYMSMGIALSLWVFFWALKNGQFGDQQRARYLPLSADAGPSARKTSRFARIEAYALWMIAFLGIALTGGVLIFAMASAV